jgi:hypothetical protein
LTTEAGFGSAKTASVGIGASTEPSRKEKNGGMEGIAVSTSTAVCWNRRLSLSVSADRPTFPFCLRFTKRTSSSARDPDLLEGVSFTRMDGFLGRVSSSPSWLTLLPPSKYSIKREL